MDISGRRFTAQQNANGIRQKAENEWFGTAEICEMIANHQSLGLLITEKPKTTESGSLFVITRENLRKFRKDGRPWSRKKDGKTIQESHVNLKVGGDEMVECLYVREQENENFQRRIYRMLKGEHLDKALFHYREDKGPRKYSKRERETTEIRAQSFTETGKTIPSLGIISSGDGMADYKSECENQSVSQESKNNFLPDPDTPGGYYELQESKKSVEQFSEENWKNCKRSKKLNNLEVKGFPSSFVNHKTIQLPAPSSADHESYRLASPPQTAYSSNLNEIQGYAKLGDGSSCSKCFTGGGMQDCKNDLKNLSPLANFCDVSELLESMEEFFQKENLNEGSEIPEDLAK